MLRPYVGQKILKIFGKTSERVWATKSKTVVQSACRPGWVPFYPDNIFIMSQLRCDTRANKAMK